MKMSRRNINRLTAAQEKRIKGKPALSRYEAKRRGEPETLPVDYRERLAQHFGGEQ